MREGAVAPEGNSLRTAPAFTGCECLAFAGGAVNTLGGLALVFGLLVDTTGGHYLVENSVIVTEHLLPQRERRPPGAPPRRGGPPRASCPAGAPAAHVDDDALHLRRQTSDARLLSMLVFPQAGTFWTGMAVTVTGGLLATTLMAPLAAVTAGAGARRVGTVGVHVDAKRDSSSQNPGNDTRAHSASVTVVVPCATRPATPMAMAMRWSS